MRADLRMTVAVLFTLAFIASITQAFGSQQKTESCAPYYETRIAFLLGCCGDLELGYPGPRFPVQDSRSERATLAITEVDQALRQKCLDNTNPKFFDILLDRVGAYILRASENFGNQNSDNTAPLRATNDFVQAGRFLDDFVHRYPSESVARWYWITEALERAGEPRSALQFITRLPSDCCDEAEIARVRGDLLFNMGNQGGAAAAYAQWVKTSNQTSNLKCNHPTSFAHATLLDSNGFLALPPPSRQKSMSLTFCFSSDGWSPYFRN
jgi:hypothetical protein